MVKIILCLFGIPFAVGGALLVREAIKSMSAAEPILAAILMPWGVGIVFSLTGWGLILIGFVGKEVRPGEESPMDQRKRALGIKSPDQEWKEGRMRSTGLGAVIGGWVKAVLSMLFCAPALWIGSVRGFIGGDPGFRYWTAIGLLPCGFLAQAIYRTIRRRKFGASICEIVSRPGPGQKFLRLFIRPESAELPEGVATVELRCEKRVDTGTGKNRRTTTTVLWREIKTVPVQSTHLGIQATFEIPESLPDAQSQKGQGIFWWLESRCQAPGINYFAQFNVAMKRSSPLH